MKGCENVITKKIHVVFVAFVACLLALLNTSPASAAPQTNNLTAPEALEKIATSYFSQSAEIMVEGYDIHANTNSIRSIDTKESKVGNESFSQAVDSYRQELSALGEEYSSSRTNVTIDKVVSKNDDAIRVIATETTFLTIKGTEVETGYSAKHELFFSCCRWRMGIEY